MPSTSLSFAASPVGDRTPITVELEVTSLVMAGWVGRDSKALQAHIDELAAIGVKAPSSVPCFYRVATNQLTMSARVQVLGPDTSGEVEYVLVESTDGLWIGVGSDETDRRLEAYSVAASKQICAKSVAPVLWRYEDVALHWDELRLRSWVTRESARHLYQDRAVSDLLPPPDLVARYLGREGGLPPGTMLFGGTCAAIGPINGGTRFDYELADPILGRRIAHGYDLDVLPIVG